MDLGSMMLSQHTQFYIKTYTMCKALITLYDAEVRPSGQGWQY